MRHSQPPPEMPEPDDEAFAEAADDDPVDAVEERYEDQRYEDGEPGEEALDGEPAGEQTFAEAPPARRSRIRDALARRRGLVGRIRQNLPPRTGPLRQVPPIDRTGAPETGGRADPDGRAMLRVVTLNLAHGRSTGFHQALKRSRTIRRNLDAVAALLRRERPDVVAFQEADGPSFWSGGFDHVEFIAEASGFGWRMRGQHMVAPRIQYGTALAARLPLSDPLSVTFAPSPPTFNKGFVLGTVVHPTAPDCPIDVVSVHLDFARAAIRRRQVETLIEELRGRDRLRIVVGDFNTSWDAREQALRRLADALGLRAHDPDAPLVTFPFHRRRLDWIFASRALDIVEHRVLPDVVSDHRGVLAGVRLP